MERSPGFWMFQPLRKYAVFSGRAPRAEYWWFYLFCLSVSTISTVLVEYLPPIADLVFGLGLLLPQIAVGVRRLHDVNRSGQWIVIPLIAGILVLLGYQFTGPSIMEDIGETWRAIAFGVMALALAVYAILMLVWFCTLGTPGSNRYGPDPLDPDDDFAEVFS